MRLTKSCPICFKNLEIISEFDITPTEKLVSYKCGHSLVIEPEINTTKELVFTSLDGSKTARKYQKEGVEFIVKSNFNCILADQQRLGKTPQALIALKNYREEMTPTLIVVRSANIYQWLREYQSWVDRLPMGAWIIQGTKNWIPPGFSAYLISMDTFSRPGTCTVCGHSASHHKDGQPCNKGIKSKQNYKKCGCETLIEKDSMVQKLLAFGFKLIIVDECHSFKNADSNRSQALVQFLHKISEKEIIQQVPFTCLLCKHQWEEQIKMLVTKDTTTISKTVHCPACHAMNRFSAAKELIEKQKPCGVIMLSGTPIKNRADEYYVPLNIVAPEKFPSITNFRRKFLVQDRRGRYTRISPYAIDQFKETIAPYVLRREKEDVYQDIPKLNRMFTIVTVEDSHIKEIYNKVLDKIEEDMVKPNYNFFSSIGELAQLRQICGLAKVDWTVDYVSEAITDGNGAKPKFAIGVHHHSVRNILTSKLYDFGVCQLDGTTSAAEKDRIAHRYFETADEQVLILGMMAAKEGIELVYLKNALVLEREWSSAEEEQFEYRFYNPDFDFLRKRGLENKVTDIEYVLAKGTIDEFFYDLVEEKRKIFGETISTQWDLSQDRGSFMQLMERTVAGRL